jgi:hypothetical protein
MKENLDKIFQIINTIHEKEILKAEKMKNGIKQFMKEITRSGPIILNTKD